MGNGFKGFSHILAPQRVTDVQVVGRQGATAGADLAGATTGGAPTSGTFEVGDVVVDRTGALWVCTTAGSPGTWKEAGLYYRGAWSNTTTYGPNDLVTYNNQLWVAGTASTGTTPTVSSLYAATVLADAPTVYYRLGDAVGSGSALDSSGGGHTGIIDGTITFGASGAIPTEGDTAATFNPGSALVEPIQYGNPQTYTLETWFKTVAAVSQGLFMFNDTTGLTGGSLDRHVFMASSGQVSGDRGNDFSPRSYNDGQWHHLVVTQNAGSNLTYVDGVLVATGSYSGANFNGFWMIGNAYLPGYQYWNGSLDEVAIYAGTALSATRIAVHYNAATSPNPWSLVAINPMTTQGDLVYGGSGGVPTRLPAGASTTVLAGGTTPAFTGSPTVSGELTAQDFKPSGLSGATGASRYVGATASGAPTSGTFAVGDYIIDRTGKLWICTVAGTPGTWTQTSGSSPLTTKGDLYGHSTVDARVPVGADGTFLAADSSQAAGLSYKFPAGIAGVSTLSSYLSANVTVSSANTYYDTVSLTLTAGTWLLAGAVTVYSSGSGPNWTFKLWDGTTTYAVGEEVAAANGVMFTQPLTAIVSPTVTTTYKLSAAADRTGGTTAIYAAPVNNSPGNYATYLQAVQLTGAPASGPGALMPAVRCYNSANISIPNNVPTLLTFDTNRVDQGTSTPQHSTSTNTGRLVCQQAGMYQITGQVVWAANGAGARGVSIRLNGATTIGENQWLFISSGAGVPQCVTTLYPLAVGDYVELLAVQTSGGSLNVNVTGNESPEFMMARVDSGPGAVQPNTKVQLDYTNTTTYNYTGLAFGAWVDVSPTLNFNVDDLNSVVEVLVNGHVLADGTQGWQCRSRVLLDGSTTRFIGGSDFPANGIGTNVLSGAVPLAFTGLSAGVHTLKIQAEGDGGGAQIRLDASADFMYVKVLERKQSSSPPSSTPAPAVRVVNSTAITGILNNTTTIIPFDTTVFDQGTSTSQHSTTSNTSRLTCQQAGVYNITGNVQWVNQNGTGQRILRILLNGATVLADNNLPGFATFGQENVVSVMYRLAVGDYVELQALQDSGVTSQILQNSYSPSFGMARVDSGGQGFVPIPMVKTANYSILGSDCMLVAGANSLTFTLPAASSRAPGLPLLIKNDNFTGTAIARTGSDTIDDATSFSLPDAYSAVQLVSDGISKWRIF